MSKAKEERGNLSPVKQALLALEEMRAAGLQPNEFTYAGAIAAVAAAAGSIGCAAAVELGRVLIAAMARDGLVVNATTAAGKDVDKEELGDISTLADTRFG